MTTTHSAPQPLLAPGDDDQKATILPPSSDVGCRARVVQRPLELEDATIAGHGITAEVTHPLRRAHTYVRLCMRADDLPCYLDRASVEELRDYLAAALEVMS